MVTTVKFILASTLICQLPRFWNEPRCSRKFVGIEKYHSKFCLDVHDFSDHFNPPQPPVQPPQPPVNAGDHLAHGAFGIDANALVPTPEKQKTQLNVDADKINAKFTIGYYSIIIRFSFHALFDQTKGDGIITYKVLL